MKNISVAKYPDVRMVNYCWGSHGTRICFMWLLRMKESWSLHFIYYRHKFWGFTFCLPEVQFLLFSFSFFKVLQKYGWFTMFCYFLLYNKVNQLYMYTHPFLFRIFSHIGFTEYWVGFPVLHSRSWLASHSIYHSGKFLCFLSKCWEIALYKCKFHFSFLSFL